MEPSKKDINRILQLSDEELKKTIEEIAKAIGADGKKAEALTSDIPSLKSNLSKMNDADLKRIIESAGKDKAQKIMNEINKK